MGAKIRGVDPGDRGDRSLNLEWMDTNIDIPKVSTCYVYLCIMILWYNVVFAFSPKSEVHVSMKP